MEFLYYIFVLFSVMVMIKSDSKIRAEKKDGGVLITCDSEEEEYIYWEWKPINESQFIELPIYVNKNAFFKGYTSKALTIRYSSKDVYGNYRCRYYTNSRHRQRKRSSELVVGYPEKPAVKERKYFVKENMSITMKCFPKQSFPEGRIWWSKWPKRSDHTNCNEHNISGTDNYSGIYTSSLTIKNFDTKDVGDYVCCVKNEYGNSSSDRIKVMKGERPRVTSKQQTVYAEIGRRIMLHVNIHKGNPEANVTWYNHGAPFLKSGTERYSGYNISHPGLWIYNVTQNDSGTYRCSAVNIFNSSSVEIRLIAGNIPIVDSNSLEIVSFSGKELIIHCKHDIKSEPTKVEWIYNDNFAILVSQSKRHSGGNLSIPSLTIHASKKSDSGKYVCCITNDFGVGCSSVIEVTITAQTTTGPVRWNTTNAPERHDVTCSVDSMSVFVPMSVLSSKDSLTWRDPHCQVSSNGTHFESTILHSACGTTVLFTNDEIIFENELLIHQQGLQNVIPLNGSVQIDFGQKNYDIIPVRCVYLRNMNVTTSYRPAQSHIRFYEKRYGHLDVVLEQFKSDQFVTALPARSYPMEVELNKDIFFKLRASHVNSSDVALKVESCIATPSLFPASSQTYELLKQGCPSSPAVKLFPSSYEEVRFGVRAFEFSQSPGGVVYIHCQVSLCSSASPQCVTGCSSRHRREAVGSEGSSQLISGGPYLVVADEGSIQASTIVAAVCACIAVVSTVFAVIGWRRKLERSAA